MLVCKRERQIKKIIIFVLALSVRVAKFKAHSTFPFSHHQSAQIKKTHNSMRKNKAEFVHNAVAHLTIELQCYVHQKSMGLSFQFFIISVFLTRDILS